MTDIKLSIDCGKTHCDNCDYLSNSMGDTLYSWCTLFGEEFEYVWPKSPERCHQCIDAERHFNENK